MADQNTTNQGTGAAAVKSSDGMVVDKNKSSEQYIKESESHYIIPSLVREKFSDLVKLIYETESMNAEEREYWMQILPIMSEEQITKFRTILVNEKDQLAKLDKEYEQEMSKINPSSAKPINEVELKQKMAEIKKAEKSQESREAAEEEELLKKLAE